jgi:predicted lactoylglutathione lyase
MSATQATNMFINLPVSDVNRSITFFKAIGFEFNPQFTNDQAGCMLVGPNIFAMLVGKDYFATFTKKPIADATQSTEVITALSFNSREEVDALADKAIAAGGIAYADPTDHGFMYQRVFADPDGHQWELFWMDPAAIQG